MHSNQAKLAEQDLNFSFVWTSQGLRKVLEKIQEAE